MSVALWHEVQQFLFQEARLLDERRFDEWLDLLTEDAVYWMPIKSNRYDKELKDEVSKPGELAYYDDDKKTLRNRVARLHSGMAWSESPPARTRHIISNVEVTPEAKKDEVTVRCALLVYRTHLEHDEDFFVGCREDRLRKVDGSWKIAKRTVILDQVVLSPKNLAVFF
mgnify:CR=1 FL=1